MRVWLLLFAAFATAHAAEFAYTIPAPPGAELDTPAVTRAGAWEVTVAYYRETCEVVCFYRLRNERLPLFLPPVVSIRIRSGMKISTVVLDPAHTRESSLLPLDRLEDPDDAMPAQAPSQPPVEPVEPLVHSVPDRTPEGPLAVRAVISPLRI